MGSIYVVSLLFVGLSMLVSARLRSKFSQYNNIPLASGLTGREVAERMLKENGIYDVKVTSVPGALTDHYNPVTKTVNLSEEVYMVCKNTIWWCLHYIQRTELMVQCPELPQVCKFRS